MGCISTAKCLANLSSVLPKSSKGNESQMQNLRTFCAFADAYAHILYLYITLHIHVGRILYDRIYILFCGTCIHKCSIQICAQIYVYLIILPLFSQLITSSLSPASHSQAAGLRSAGKMGCGLETPWDHGTRWYQTCTLTGKIHRNIRFTDFESNGWWKIGMFGDFRDFGLVFFFVECCCPYLMLFMLRIELLT